MTRDRFAIGTSVQLVVGDAGFSAVDVLKVIRVCGDTIDMRDIDGGDCTMVVRDEHVVPGTRLVLNQYPSDPAKAFTAKVTHVFDDRIETELPDRDLLIICVGRKSVFPLDGYDNPFGENKET